MKKLNLLIIILIISGTLFAQEVVKEELFKVNRDSVEFVNYEGPHDKFETADEIRGIGISLGGKSEQLSGTRTYNNKYSILHLFDPEGQGLLNGDIFSIEKDAVVDHIDNVRRILSGYLQTAYSYSKEDSDVLAEFASYYNAVYRGNFEYFISAYNKIVTDNLDSEKAGISTRYMEWPGNTQILIPLTPGGKMAIDTISDNTVIEDLRTQDDKGIEPRKDMVELKEKDIEAEQTKIEDKKEVILQKESELQAEKEQLNNESENLSDKEITSKENIIAQKEQILNQEKEEVKKEDVVQKERQDAVQKEREQIAKDENKLIDQQSKAGVAAKTKTSMVPFLVIDKDNSDYMGRIALINTETGEIEKKSSINTVRGRRYYLLDGKLLIVSGIDKAPQSVRLMFLNSETLEVISQGNYDVFADSDVLINGKNIYAVVRENDSWYVGKFNPELKLLVRSNQEVLSHTPLQLNKGILYAQLSNGKIAPISPDTLEGMGK